SDFDAAVRRELNKARTLSEALNSYCRLVTREQSHVLCHVTAHISGEAQIHGTAGLGLGPDQHEYSEWLLIMSLVAIVRHAAGSDWCPSQVTFQSQPAFGKSVWKAFPGTCLLVGQSETCVTVPAEILSLPWPDGRETATTQPIPAEFVPSHSDFPSSLSLAIRPYLADGYPTIELAAELAGISVRTLQRRLSQCHLSYSDLVKHLRFEVATALLADPHNTVIDAACEVGFSDPSHFSRAFRRMAGVSPREFRRQQLAA
ncbi:MAG: helix-turn-helix transcriptional regulator, partial [Sedimenticolaceae bacterium]